LNGDEDVAADHPGTEVRSWIGILFLQRNIRVDALGGSWPIVFAVNGLLSVTCAVPPLGRQCNPA
jgi:hypothetical protein